MDTSIASHVWFIRQDENGGGFMDIRYEKGRIISKQENILVLDTGGEGQSWSCLYLRSPFECFQDEVVAKDEAEKISLQLKRSGRVVHFQGSEI